MSILLFLISFFLRNVRLCQHVRLMCICLALNPPSHDMAHVLQEEETKKMLRTYISSCVWNTR